MTARRAAAAAILLALLTLAGAALWRSATTSADPAQQLAASLRCPACQGETVAESRSPVAASMRAEITRQLAAGREPDQVRSWFTERYGPEVLADPSGTGVGVLLWVIPAAAGAGVLTLAVRARRARRPATTPADPPAPSWLRRHAWTVGAVSVVTMVCGVAVAAGELAGRPAPPAAASQEADPVTEQLAIAQDLEHQGRFPAAAGAYALALQLRPDPVVRLRLAFAQLRSGDADAAAASAGQVLAAEPGNADALLVLGLAERAAQDPAAGATLSRFLAVAPDHPGAAEVRRLLGQVAK
ncbi:cytochrome c-type biogenesis protein CcmH [Amycolatopsis thermoflava]|uniref:cytochrome c-type biogenesis protein CcmH n=1 Tax=Amycolatopsis thermoflava TaxID=84480 RepID=UPI003EC10563